MVVMVPLQFMNCGGSTIDNILSHRLSMVLLCSEALGTSS